MNALLMDTGSGKDLINKVIAKLNHQAYKAINKPALKKMLDKRSTQSQSLYLQ